MSKPQRLVSLATAATYLDFNPKTLRRWVAEGKLTGYRVGTKTLRLDMAEVESLVQPIVTVGTLHGRQK